MAKKPETKKEITMAQESNAVVVTAESFPSYPRIPAGPSTAEQSRRDEVFSVARMIQAMSKQESCQNPNGEDFKKGDMIVYPQRMKIGDYKTPFGVIFLRNTIEWANFEVVGQKEEWRSEEPRIDRTEAAGGNEHWPLKYTHDGKSMVRYRQTTLFVLLPAQVKAFLEDALSDTPALSGSVKPIAIKLRNSSKRVADEIVDSVAGPDFQTRNAVRMKAGRAPIPVYAYEHTLLVKDKTNAKGTFQILTRLKVEAVKDPQVLEIAAGLHAAIAAQTELKTVVMEDSQGSSSRGEVSDEV